MVNVDAARRTRRKHRLRYLRIRPLSQAGRKKKVADTYTFFARLSSSSREIIAPVAGQTYSELYIIFDKAAAPTASFITQGDDNYQHGYRIYANGLTKSEKTALYIVPSHLNDGNLLYGVTYLPGIGFTQAIYGDAGAGSIGDLFYFKLTLPEGGVQWTDDMPTEWYIKDSEGWQDLGPVLFSLLANSSSSTGVIPDNTALNANKTLSPINSFSRSLENGLYRYHLNNNSYYEIQVTSVNEIALSLFAGSSIFHLTMSYNSEYYISITTGFSIDYRNNIYPMLIFAEQFTPVV